MRKPGGPGSFTRILAAFRARLISLHIGLQPPVSHGAESQLLRATQNRCMIRFSQGDDMIIYGVGLRAVADCL